MPPGALARRGGGAGPPSDSRPTRPGIGRTAAHPPRLRRPMSQRGRASSRPVRGPAGRPSRERPGRHRLSRSSILRSLAFARPGTEGWAGNVDPGPPPRPRLPAGRDAAGGRSWGPSTARARGPTGSRSRWRTAGGTTCSSPSSAGGGSRAATTTERGTTGRTRRAGTTRGRDRRPARGAAPQAAGRQVPRLCRGRATTAYGVRSRDGTAAPARLPPLRQADDLKLDGQGAREKRGEAAGSHRPPLQSSAEQHAQDTSGLGTLAK
mmetsp:Transcript_15396/g.35539  ORF Transcript_15396/g.35539 Transcript_15396/m.35539 type:complete len:265 (+) Transcript_15396:141-935(+)